jgi:hypothetical protein
VGADGFWASARLSAAAVSEGFQRIEPYLWTMIALIEAWFLAQDWYFGKIHTSLLANSRTLAMIVPGSPIRFIKRRDCVAVGGGGTSLLLADASEVILPRPALAPLFSLKAFEGLFAFWWPQHRHDDVRRFFADRGALKSVWLLLTIFLTVTVLITVILLIAFGTWQTRLIVGMPLAPLSIVGFLYLRKRVRALRAVAYPLGDGMLPGVHHGRD